MVRTLRRARTRTNPVFYPDRVGTLLAHDAERLERMREDPASVDLLTWNVFVSMDSDPERGYLASVLRPLADARMREPVRLTLWTGRHREPLLHPSRAYLRHLEETVGDDPSLAVFKQSAEVPVRIEAPGLLVLVETALEAVPRGGGGRDRLIELVDAGLDQARNLSSALVVAVVYASGTPTAGALSARVNALRDPDTLAAALPWRDRVPEVGFREMSWQELLRIWERERGSYRLFGQPVRGFREYASALGLA